MEEKKVNNNEQPENKETLEEKDKNAKEEKAKNKNIKEDTTEKKKENTKENELHTNQEFDELNDRYKRILAEFENYKKRSQKERENLYNSIVGDIILAMLPALDNLENAVKADCQDDKYKQGVELVEKQFREFLKKHNVEEIETEGQIFDPSVHEAVSTVQDPNKESQEIIQEFRKGYKIGSKVLRHSMVVVNE